MSRMISKLDAVVVGVNDLSAAAADYAALINVARREVSFQGKSGVSFQLDNMRLVLVAEPDRQGIKQLVFGCHDIDVARGRLPKVGIDIDADASDEGFLQLVPASTRGVNLALAHDQAHDRETVGSTAASAGALVGLDHAVIGSGDGDYTAALLSSRLQLDMRLDLTNPDWDARLMFFRCGDMIIEVYQSLSSPAAPEKDRFFGLSWRTNDIDATHTELLERGFDVSEVRKGRRPDTRVCTVRNKTHGVPTLLLEKA